MSLEKREMIRNEIKRLEGKSGLPLKTLLLFGGISMRTWEEWQGRQGVERKHNNNIPKAYYLMPEEIEAIAAYCETNNEGGLKGYRVLSYEMIDKDVAFAAPSSVYNVLKTRHLFQKWAQNTENGNTGKKGFDQPLAVHEQWHIDFSYIKVCGIFYYFIGVLDGYRRRMLNWKLCLTMKGLNAEVLVAETKQMYPEAKNPRLISDNGSQFTSKDFEELLVYLEIGHTCASPSHPQSNGKLERFHRTWKTENVRREAFLDYDDTVKQIGRWINYYNSVRLHSAICYLTPDDVFYGRKEKRLAERNEKLYTARVTRKSYWQAKAAGAPITL
jgi:transposase InsO family protein